LKGHSTSDPLAGPDWDGKLARTDIDYVANNGRLLEEANTTDKAVAQKLKDILDIFHEFDEKARVAIEAEYAKLQ
jgi:transaldolase